jgi:dTDP-4-dehydrorhamnose 3,5-epimerase-like enzyme
MVNCRLMEFKQFFGKLGALTAIEGSQDIPFEIRRVYYITGVPEDVTRGFHSHRHLEQILLCLNGSVNVRLKTPNDEEIVMLDNPTKGLYIGHMIWREMFDFSPGAVLMVLASEHYTENDYIRNYQQYIELAVPYFKESEVS